MARTEIRSGQIKDSTVNKDDIDVSTTGKALVTKIIAGTNITLGSTGVDAGTGDVTVNGPTIDATITNGSNNPITSNAVFDALTVSAGSKLLGRGDSGAGQMQEITIGSGLSMTGTTLAASAGSGDMVLADVQTVTGAKTFNDGKLIVAGATSGTMAIKTQAVAGTSEVKIAASGTNVHTFPSATDTLVGRASTDTLTNKTITDSTNTVYDSRVKISRLSGDYTNATTTGTEITGLSFASTGTGTFSFEFWLLVQSSATGTGWKLGVNHTGTATLLSANMLYPSTGASGATGVGENAVANNTGSLYEAAATETLSTTAPNLGPTAGVAATGTSVLVRVLGLIAVTGTGDLEIWCGAETTGTITVKTDSVGQLIKYT